MHYEWLWCYEYNNERKVISYETKYSIQVGVINTHCKYLMVAKYSGASKIWSQYWCQYYAKRQLHLRFLLIHESFISLNSIMWRRFITQNTFYIFYDLILYRNNLYKTNVGTKILYYDTTGVMSLALPDMFKSVHNFVYYKVLCGPQLHPNFFI